MAPNRNLLSGEIADCVCLQILFAYEDEMGEDVIASLDFWGKGPGG